MTKKKKKQKNSHIFPSIYRIITENQYWVNSFRAKAIFLLLVFLCLLILIPLSLNLTKNYKDYIVLEKHRNELIRKEAFWTGISQKYDGFKDAFFQIALLNYQLGNFNKAKEANEKALLLDPNFDEARKLKEILSY